MTTSGNKKMDIRAATPADLPHITRLVQAAKAIMRDSGNTQQWNGEYPSDDLLRADIRSGFCHLVLQDGKAVGSFVFKPGPDPTYASIYDGQWLDDAPYYVIHRITSTPEAHGVFKTLVDFCFCAHPNIRIDTHRDNTIMRHLLSDNGFAYCGIIHLMDGDERLAYQKTIMRITEQPSHYDHLERMTVDQITAGIQKESLAVPLAIGKALPQLNRLITAIEQHLEQGGRLFYVGCGTGGRLATLDTIEVQNTYGTDGSQIQAVFPGGTECLTQTRESREDDTEDSWRQLLQKGISAKDIVVGFSASGTTPFVLAALRHCQAANIATGCVVNNPHSPIAQIADHAVEIITGPEFVTGSTRMKAGTSQKLCLDMISTTVQIRLGRVEGNKMVNAKLMNHKLIDRAVRIFMERNPQHNDYNKVKQLLLKAGSVKKAEENL